MTLKCLYKFFQNRKTAPKKAIPKNSQERGKLWKHRKDIEKLVKEYMDMKLEKGNIHQF
jgi:hypothetical protein